MHKRAFVIVAIFMVGLSQTIESSKEKYLDEQFGNGGIVITDVRKRTHDRGYDLQIQPDGKIVVAGETCKRYGRPCDVVLLRYDSNGALDPTFGHQGKTVSNFYGEFDTAKTLAVSSDGKIYVGAESKRFGQQNWNIAIGRYTSSGLPDHSFV